MPRHRVARHQAKAADDIEGEHERVQTLGATGVTDVVEISLMAPYRFFQFRDTEGNVIEVGWMG